MFSRRVKDPLEPHFLEFLAAQCMSLVRSGVEVRSHWVCSQRTLQSASVQADLLFERCKFMQIQEAFLKRHLNVRTHELVWRHISIGERQATTGYSTKWKGFATTPAIA